ncbi:MAG TPA: MoaD/ThiS family protein [Thermoleophilia bacterium]|nr:MoaD/ThiS family protein [Thermoleophilia bacterium]
MIDVRLFATLPMHSATGRKQFQLEPRAQLTVGEVVDAEGLRRADIHIIMINGKHASMDSELVDGDRLGLFPPVGGG